LREAVATALEANAPPGQRCRPEGGHMGGRARDENDGFRYDGVGTHRGVSISGGP
jgi:hypothetical protein